MNFYYETKGDGNDIVLLHGYVGDTEDFLNQVEILAIEHRVSVLDERGRGKTEALPKEEDYSIELFVDDIYK